MIIYLSFLYLFIGITFLLIPLTYIELSRPRDFIRAGLNFVIGMLFLLKNNVFDNLYSSIFLIITILFVFYLLEIFSIRWNQLSDKEKNRLKTLVEFRKNVSTLMEAILLARKDFLNLNIILNFGRNNKNLNKKKWVRNTENDNIDNSNKNNLLTLEMPKKVTIQSKKDTMDNEKN